MVRKTLTNNKIIQIWITPAAFSPPTLRVNDRKIFRPFLLYKYYIVPYSIYIPSLGLRLNN